MLATRKTPSESNFPTQIVAEPTSDKSGNDAEMAVINDEDGAYEPWEWDNLDTYREEEVDWQQGEANDIAGEITAKIVFPAQTGNRTSSGLTFGDGSDD